MKTVNKIEIWVYTWVALMLFLYLSFAFVTGVMVPFNWLEPIRLLFVLFTGLAFPLAYALGDAVNDFLIAEKRRGERNGDV